MKVVILDYYINSPRSLSKMVKKYLPYADIHSFSGDQKLEEYIRKNGADLVILDISRWTAPGLLLIAKLMEMYHKLNLVVVSDNPRVALDLMHLRVSGLLLKPFSEKQLQNELDNLRYPILELEVRNERVEIKDSGDIFFCGKPIKFSLNKAYVLFLYLVKADGGYVSMEKIVDELFPNRKHDPTTKSMVRNIVCSMKKGLEEAGVGNILLKKRGYLAIAMEKICSDYPASSHSPAPLEECSDSENDG